ncbi:MAG: AAA family ATPase [Planctomycetes bacterium]|nr:AAA family ATPase [Planctomycetota bacterium]
MKINLPPGADDPVKNALSILEDSSMPPKARAEFLLHSAQALGYDLMNPLARLLDRCDKGRELEKLNAQLAAKLAQLEEEKRQPLVPEIFLRSVDRGDGACWGLIESQAGPLLCPMDGGLTGLRRGVYVLLERSSGKIVDRDGVIVPTGEIAKVEEVLDGDPVQVIVSLHDRRFKAQVSEAVQSSGELRPGAEVLFDASRRFVHDILHPRLEGEDLLTPASELSGFSLQNLGAPHPVIFEIVNSVKRRLLHPEWESLLQARQRRSYLFHGITGSGKSSSIKVIANLIADFIEELTGVREPRMVVASCADFYSPFFGESELKVARWFKKLGAIARKAVLAKDGRRIVLPLLVVFEELEGLIRGRGEFGGSSHLFDRILSLILHKMDSVTNELEAPIIFISTTNMMMLLDAAGLRRFGQRQIMFSALDALSAYQVLEKKLPADMPYSTPPGIPSSSARRQLLESLIHYLFGRHDEQAIAEVTLRDTSKKIVSRKDVITGSFLETALCVAIDEVLDRSTAEGELRGIDADTITRALARQFDALAANLHPHNLRDLVPHLFPEEAVQIASVRPVKRYGRRPVDYYFQ